MITEADYWMGRDTHYPDELTVQIRENAAVTIRRANSLLTTFGEDRAVTSGWRPKAVNEATHGAAPLSKHMTGQAIDLADPEGDLDQFCLDHPDVLANIGLWQEHPASTKGWCHVQIVPPRSGNRVFYP